MQSFGRFQTCLYADRLHILRKTYLALKAAELHGREGPERRRQVYFREDTLVFALVSPSHSLIGLQRPCFRAELRERRRRVVIYSTRELDYLTKSRGILV